jgi:hypothetical protein
MISIGGKQYAQARDGWIEILVEDRTVRVTAQSTKCSGESEHVSGGFRDLEPSFLTTITDEYTPFSPVEIAQVIPKLGDRVEVYGHAIATSDAEASFRDTPANKVTRMRALLLARNGSLDEAIATEFPQPVRAELRDQRATLKSWLGTLVMLALAAVVFRVWRNRVAAIGFLAIALVVRPRIVHYFRAGSDAVPYAPRSNLFFNLYGYSFPGMVLVTALRLQSPHVTAWFVVGYFVVGVALALANLRELDPFRRLVTAKRWTGGDADEARVEGTIADSTPTKDEGAALARVEAWDRGSFGSRDASVKNIEFKNVGTYTILSKTGDVVVKPSETQWASSVVTRSDDPEDKDQFVQTELVPIGGSVAAVGSIVDGKLVSKGTAPALVLATSAMGDPLSLARNTIRHDMITLAGLVIAAGLATMLALQ